MAYETNYPLTGWKGCRVAFIKEYGKTIGFDKEIDYKSPELITLLKTFYISKAQFYIILLRLEKLDFAAIYKEFKNNQHITKSFIIHEITFKTNK